MKEVLSEHSRSQCHGYNKNRDIREKYENKWSLLERVDLSILKMFGHMEKIDEGVFPKITLVRNGHSNISTHDNAENRQSYFNISVNPS